MRFVRDLFHISKSGDSDWGITFLVIGGFFLAMIVILLVKKIIERF